MLAAGIAAAMAVLALVAGATGLQGDAERALPAAGPLDIERIGLAAQRTGAVAILGPPPFGGPGA